MQVITSERIPIKMWIDELEDSAMEQAKHLANLPFAIKHIAIMPDSHMGYGMPIGAVLATKNVIIPDAVGVDIGCGVIAVKTNITEITKEQLKKIMSKIRQVVPVGFKHHKEPQMDYRFEMEPYTEIVELELKNALCQIGTLGGGNHFIELQKDQEGYVWIMIHSGSRNIGYKVAKHYNKLAMELNEQWYSSVPLKWELAFLPLTTTEGRNYLRDMQFCVDFAFLNRSVMLSKIKTCINEVVGDVDFEEPINKAHNYAIRENHFGENMVIHRKGATQAYEGQLGIIPGSQGTTSYIVRGKGNVDSFKSCSHGAGRKLGRKQAQKILNLEEEKARLDNLGVVHAIRTEKDLDEAPGAYKDITEVMRQQEELIEIVETLTPLAVIKG